MCVVSLEPLTTIIDPETLVGSGRESGHFSQQHHPHEFPASCAPNHKAARSRRSPEIHVQFMYKGRHGLMVARSLLRFVALNQPCLVDADGCRRRGTEQKNSTEIPEPLINK